jgi:uncharacterized protein
MRRAIFDSTVLVAAFLRPGGLADELVTMAAEGHFNLVLSSAIILETWRTLLSEDHIRSRYRYSDERTCIFCLGLGEIAANVLRRIAPLSGIVRDPRDDMIIACALDGGADTIVSRDKDLLALGAYQGIAIVAPETFRGQLRGAG